MRALVLAVLLAVAGCGGATSPVSEEAVPLPASAHATSRTLFVCAERPELAPALACLEEQCAAGGAGGGHLVDNGEQCMLAACEPELEALERASGACYWCTVVEVLNDATFDDAVAFCGGQP